MGLARFREYGNACSGFDHPDQSYRRIILGQDARSVGAERERLNETGSLPLSTDALGGAAPILAILAGGGRAVQSRKA